MGFSKQKRDSELRSDHAINLTFDLDQTCLFFFKLFFKTSVWDLFDPKKPGLFWFGGHLVRDEQLHRTAVLVLDAFHLIWMKWVDSVGYPEMWYLDHRDVPLKTGIKVRWIRWSWITKNGISKSGSIWARLNFWKNWALGITFCILRWMAVCSWVDGQPLKYRNRFSFLFFCYKFWNKNEQNKKKWEQKINWN